MDTPVEIVPFSNPEFGQLRTVESDGRTLFCARDVATALGYSDTNNAVKQHCRGVAIYHPISDQLGRAQRARFITEGDLYRLVASSKLPGAQRFESWVFDDVLPTIRSHGGYLTPAKVEEALTDPDTIIRLAQSLKAERAARAELQRENDALRPRAALAESAIDLSGSMSLTEAARYLAQVDPAMTRKRLTALLRADGIVCQRGTAPTREGIGRGYVVQKLPSFRSKDGTMRTGAPYAHLTAKGLDWACRRYCAGARGEVA